MVVSVHQPAFLPWLGYFNKIIRSDKFVFLDTVQFEKGSFVNRNRIKGNNGVIWLTVPIKIKGHMTNTIKNILIDNTQKWQRRHLNSIFFNYRKAKYFDRLYPQLEQLYQERYDFLSDLTYSQLKFWLDELNINTKVIKSEDLSTQRRKSDLILELCLRLGADQYLAGSLSKNYLDESAFRQQSIDIEYQNYQGPKYPQLFSGFIPNLSIVDYWMNTHNTIFIREE